MKDPILEISIKKYGTTNNYCGCPDYTYRSPMGKARYGTICKHIKYLKENHNDIEESTKPKVNFDKDDFRGKGMNVDEASKKYGEYMLDRLKKEGEIFMYSNSILKILE